MEKGELVKRLSLLEDQKNLLLASITKANTLSLFDDHSSTTSKEEVDSDTESIVAEKLIPLDMVNSEAVLLEQSGFTAFELRVNHLEKSVWGYDPSGNKMKKDYGDQMSLLTRIEEIRKQLNGVVRDKEGLKSFLEQYDQASSLVSPFVDNLALERKILTPEGKAEIVVASSEELERVADSLKDIGELQGIIDAPEFKGLEKLFPLITPLESKHVDQIAQSNKASARITHLLDRYNRITNTLSEIFITWDQMLTTIDVHISALERKARQ